MTINRTISAEDAAAQPGTHLVYIGAGWCGYCAFTKPAIEELANDGIAGIDTVNVLDMDDDPMSGLFLEKQTDLKTLPKVVLFRDGKPLASRGSGQKEELKSWIDEQIAA